jgi:hypothetical protein
LKTLWKSFRKLSDIFKMNSKQIETSTLFLRLQWACHELLKFSGLKETGEADDDWLERQGPKPAPTLVPLAELPSSGAASQDDFAHSGPVATLRDLPAGDQLPPMVAAQARRRSAGQIPYVTGLTAGTTWGRDKHGASLDPTRKLHYHPMAALFHL